MVTDHIEDLVIIDNWQVVEPYEEYPNFDIDFKHLELDNYDYGVDTHSVAVAGTAAYSAYLASKFIAAAGVKVAVGAGVGAATVAGTHMLESVVDDTAYMFTRMATDIYQTTGEFVTGVNVNVMDYMSQAEFTGVMDSIRNFYNPASGNFQYFGGEMVHGSMPLSDIGVNFIPYSRALGTQHANLTLSRSFGKSFIVPEYFLESGNRFTLIPTVNPQSNKANFSVLDSSGNVIFADTFYSQTAQRDLVIRDYFFNLLQDGSSYHVGVSVVFDLKGVTYVANNFIFGLPRLTLDGTITANPSYSYTYTDELLNPAWDWGTATDKPLVLHPPGVIDLTIPDVIVANPEYPWVIPDTNVINPPLDPPINPPLDPPITDLSWLDRVMAGFNSVVDATTAGTATVVDAIGTAVTTVTDVVADGFSSTVTAVNTGVSSITGSIADAFGWFTAPPTVALDLSPLYISLKEVFPFSLPYDLYNLITYFKAEPEVPVFHVEFDEGLVGSGSFTIDFEPFTSVALILRYFLLLYYILGLIKLTNLLIGRSG